MHGLHLPSLARCPALPILRTRSRCRHLPLAPLSLSHTHAIPAMQLYIERAVLDEAQPEAFAAVKGLVDSGDIVGVRGGIKRTEKGELSVTVESLEVCGGVCGGGVGGGVDWWVHVCALAAKLLEVGHWG